jgi:hypothetical protein
VATKKQKAKAAAAGTATGKTVAPKKKKTSRGK